MSKNVLRLKKGMVLPHVDFLELELSKFIYDSVLGNTYTESEEKVKEFKANNKTSGYYFREGDGAYLLDTDYEIIIRKVSHKRLESESAIRVNKMLRNY